MARAAPARAGNGRRRLWLAGLAVVLLLAALVRVPLLANSVKLLTSDEAANALTVLHLVRDGEVALHPWDCTYIGLLEGLAAFPLVAIMGFKPMAFKLVPVGFFLLFLLFAFALARRLDGSPWTGVLAAGVASVLSPALVQWSTLAAGGFVLVLAAGTGALLLRESRLRSLRPLHVAAFGLILGIALYSYQLFLLYIVVFAVGGASGSWWLRYLRGGRHDPEAVRAGLVRALWFSGGFILGWGPTLATYLWGSVGAKRPYYGVAGLEAIARNVHLTVTKALPVLLGLDLGAGTSLDAMTGGGWPGSRAVALLTAGLFVMGFATALVTVRGELIDVARLRARRLSGTALLVLIVPVTLAAFLLSTNPQDALSNRYLLPIITSITVLTALFVARVWRRSRAAGVFLVAVLLATPIVNTQQWLFRRKLIGAHLAVRVDEAPLARLVARLEERGIRGAYTDYWTAYAGTMLSGERVILASLPLWDRYPPYRRYVDRLDSEAYVLVRPPRTKEQRFLGEAVMSQARSARRRVRRDRVGPYVIVTAADGGRLLQPPSWQPAEPLHDLRAEISFTKPVPETLTRGEAVRLRVTVHNRGDENWSALGRQLGRYKVTATYRWERGGLSGRFRGHWFLPHDVGPGESAEVMLRVRAPKEPGPYTLVVTLLQENVASLDLVSDSAATCLVRVVARQVE